MERLCYGLLYVRDTMALLKQYQNADPGLRGMALSVEGLQGKGRTCLVPRAHLKATLES